MLFLAKQGGFRVDIVHILLREKGFFVRLL